MNPLLNQPFQTPFQTPPFSNFQLEDFKSAIPEAINSAQKEISEIVENQEIPDFKNTIEALTLCGEKLNRISSIFFNLNSAETNENMQQLAQEISPVLAEFSNDIMLNDALFEKIKQVYELRDTFLLNTEEKELLRKTFKQFSRNGALLPPEKKEILRNIDQKLAILSLQFGQNVLAETNDYQLLLTEEEDLAGLPDYVKAMAKEEAENNGKEGWIFTLQMPSYTAFMKFADNRFLREKLYRANGAKAFQKNGHNNSGLIKEIVNLRYERAQLLGYETHAHYVMEERMAKSPEKVNEFLEDLLFKSIDFAKKDVQILSEYASKYDQIESLMPWDHAYYAEKVKKEKFDLSDEELKPYFELTKVVEGTFEIAKKLYGISFVPNDEIEKIILKFRFMK